MQKTRKRTLLDQYIINIKQIIQKDQCKGQYSEDKKTLDQIKHQLKQDNETG